MQPARSRRGTPRLPNLPNDLTEAEDAGADLAAAAVGRHRPAAMSTYPGHPEPADRAAHKEPAGLTHQHQELGDLTARKESASPTRQPVVRARSAPLSERTLRPRSDSEHLRWSDSEDPQLAEGAVVDVDCGPRALGSGHC